MTTTGTFLKGGVRASMARLNPRGRPRVDIASGLAINGDVSAVPARFEARVWGGRSGRSSSDARGACTPAVQSYPLGRAPGSCAGHPQLDRRRGRRNWCRNFPSGVKRMVAFVPVDDLGSDMPAGSWASWIFRGWWDLETSGGGDCWGSADSCRREADLSGIHPRPLSAVAGKSTRNRPPRECRIPTSIFFVTAHA